MAITKITYSNKVDLNENTSIANINKVTASDMNEIKSVANNNATNIGDLADLKTTDVSSVVNAINELSYDIQTSNSVLTGRKILGKQEYVQVVNVGACPNNIQTEIPYQTNDKFITDYYLIGISSNNEIIKAPNSSSNSSYFNVFFTANKITLATNTDRSRFTGYVYIFFTYN